MAVLKVFLNGQFESKHDLSVARELLVGRGESCDVILSPERGVSRQHFRIRHAEDRWVVEVLSRYGELYRNGEKQSIFALRNGTTFTVPPYEFVFEDDEEGLQVGTGRTSLRETHSGVEDDKTHIGYLPSTAYLRLTDQTGRAVQSFRLEGQAWIGGRDTTCSIYIENPRISRKQFELQKQDETYYIRDLGGVNPTLLNGRPLATEDWATLHSGDVVNIADWSLQFELHDAGFEQRLQDIDPALMMPMAGSYENVNQSGGFQALPNMGAASAQGLPGYESGGFVPPPTMKPGMKLFGRHIPGLNPVRLGLICFLFLALVYGVFGQDDTKPEIARALSPFEKLPPEKQQIVKQLYLTAQSLIAQGRYELARQEVIKLHQILPYYEDSKAIEETANQGLAILAEREKNEAAERQRVQIEEKIQRQVAECRSKLNPNSDSVWLAGCLESITQFNPEHPSILALQNDVERLTTERAMREANAKEYAAKVAAHRALFKRAEAEEAKGLPIPAIAAYERVLRSKLPDPGNLNSVAKRQIASLQNQLETKQLEAERKSDEAHKAGQLRKAIEILRVGIAVNPANENLKSKHAQLMEELRKQMMVFYQEGILEESVGEVEAAKKKWMRIREQSLPGEDYYEKAKMKLKKYGEN